MTRNSYYGPVIPRRVPSPGVPVSAIMRLPRNLFPRIAPLNRGGDGSSPADRDGFARCGDEPSPPRFRGRIAAVDDAQRERCILSVSPKCELAPSPREGRAGEGWGGLHARDSDADAPLPDAQPE